MNRVYHTWDKWECYPAGFYEDHPPKGMTATEAEDTYASLLRDIPAFEGALSRVLAEWPNSCEHYLSNENMNRIAWLGQASLCIARQVPSAFRGGFNKLTPEEQVLANEAALRALNQWLGIRAEPELVMDQAKSKTQPNLY